MKHREAWQVGRDGNYVNGTIRDLPIGNTELAAKMIQECTGAEFFKLEPMAVFTFLEHFDFTGKTIVPFCPHEGSGMGSSEKDIEKIHPE